MTMPNFRTPQTWIITGLCATVLGGSAWAVFRGPRAKAGGVVIPPGMSVDSLKAKVQEPDKLRETIRDTMQREDLTDEQRRQIAENMRTVWEGEMQKRVDEYFAASEEEKTAVLDRQLDEWRERMKDWEQRRKEEEKKDGEKARDDQSRRFAGMFGQQQTREQRKDRSETRNPDQMGRQMAYFAAMRNRAAERGINMPMGGGGFRGGPGGGGPRPNRGP
jgi:hypothetical protein